MAEEQPDLLSLGKHCAHPACQQLDFLPFQCDACHKTFCLQHRTYDSHSCPNANSNGIETVICPLCAKAIKLTATEDANEAWERHQAEGCDTSNYTKVHKKPRCPVAGCKEKLNSVNTYKCKDCGAAVCLKHRFGEDHGCASRRRASKPSVLGRMASARSAPRQLAASARGAAAAAAKAVAAPRPPAAAAPQQTVRSTAERRMVRDLPESCSSCGARFATVSELIRHAEEYHQQAPAAGGERCPQCGRAFPDAVALVAHVERVHHSAGQRPGQGPAPASSSVAGSIRRWLGF